MSIDELKRNISLLKAKCLPQEYDSISSSCLYDELNEVKALLEQIHDGFRSNLIPCGYELSSKKRVDQISFVSNIVGEFIANTGFDMSAEEINKYFDRLNALCLESDTLGKLNHNEIIEKKGLFVKSNRENKVKEMYLYLLGFVLIVVGSCENTLSRHLYDFTR